MKTVKIHKSKTAFTLIELMISLAIVCLILTAAGFAFDACIASYRANKDITDAVIKANQALARITTDLRSAIAVDTNSEPNNQCALLTAGHNDIVYRFDRAAGRIYLIEDGGNGPSHILCDNVSSAHFDRTTALDAFGQTVVKNVQITLTIGSGNSAQNACAAVVIRRNL